MPVKQQNTDAASFLQYLQHPITKVAHGCGYVGG